jgi:hypothetical protein
VSDHRIENVARALCLADGHDPDEEVSRLDAGDFLTPRHTGAGPTVLFHGAAWQTYAKKARAFVAAHDALTGKK